VLLRWRQETRTSRRRVYLSRERDHHYLFGEVFVQVDKYAFPYLCIIFGLHFLN
jgi:hypothetical protein